MTRGGGYGYGYGYGYGCENPFKRAPEQARPRELLRELLRERLRERLRPTRTAADRRGPRSSHR